MMRIEHVTFTGADDRTDPQALADFSSAYPRAEWGILVSRSSAGHPRFPSMKWIDGFLEVADFHNLNISLHLCGRWLRQLLRGDRTVITEIGFERWRAFQRVQLNFHAEDHEVDQSLLFPILGSQQKQFIFQVDGNMGEWLLREYLANRVNASPLFDLSHGAGESPAAWPEPDFGRPSVPVWHGYAGGLGPDNLVSELCRISEVAGPKPVWIDMETKVRDDSDAFSLPRCEQCMLHVARFESFAMDTA